MPLMISAHPGVAAYRRRGELAAPLAQIGEAHDRVHQVIVGGKFERIDAGVAEFGAQVLFALLRRRRETLAKAAIVRVDEQLFAGFRVLHDQQAQVRHLHLERVVEAHGDDFVALREVREHPAPARGADEIRYDEHDRAPAHHVESGPQQFGEVRRRRQRQPRPVQHPVHDVQHVPPTAARRDDGIHVGAVEHRADAIAMPRQHPRQHRHEVGGDRLLLDIRRTEVDRRTQVEQEPGGDLALLVEFAHIGGLQPRRDVPVDVPDVIVILIFAQIGEIEPEAAEECPVVAVQQAVEAAQHRPLEPLEDGFSRWRL